MKKNLWLSLKRDRIHANLYYQGILVGSISVHDNNRSNHAIIGLDACQELSFKIVKQLKEEENQEIDETIYNRDIYNV